MQGCRGDVFSILLQWQLSHFKSSSLKSRFQPLGLQLLYSAGRKLLSPQSVIGLAFISIAGPLYFSTVFLTIPQHSRNRRCIVICCLLVSFSCVYVPLWVLNIKVAMLQYQTGLCTVTYQMYGRTTTYTNGLMAVSLRLK